MNIGVIVEGPLDIKLQYPIVFPATLPCDANGIYRQCPFTVSRKDEGPFRFKLHSLLLQKDGFRTHETFAKAVRQTVRT